ncbi:MAG: DUF4169 family protein [Parvibaculum sp.]|nr:DUF4169 family protein [Parvibaculum sp.]
MGSDGGNIVDFSSIGKTTRKEKKQAAKKRQEASAAANRVRFGRSGAEKKIARLERERRARLLDGKRMAEQPTSDAATRKGEDEDAP